MTKIREYKGAGITVQYELKRCIHAAECVKGLPAVFDTQKRPWIQAENATADQLQEVILRCPSGALHYTCDDGEQESTPSTNHIETVADGPLYIYGDVNIHMPDGMVVKDTRVTLCRCGASENKPFCDNAHIKIQFHDEHRVEDVVENDLDETGGALEVTLRPNGPYLLTGQFEIHDAEGKRIFCGQQTALCRCGASKRKPFCDGTHKTIGFVAE